MSTFLINASNLKAGGGLQVAQSICQQLSRFSKHNFVVVISTYINDDNIAFGKNAKVYRHNADRFWSINLGAQTPSSLRICTGATIIKRYPIL